jgi:antitoxin ParD1/3/4
MSTIAVTIKEADRRFIEEAMKSGRYLSESEVVADAIAELKAREQIRRAQLAELKADIDIGIQQLNRGEGRTWNAEDIKAEGRKRLASRNHKG